MYCSLICKLAYLYNHHSKSKRLASDRPFENTTKLNQSIKMFEIGMVFGFPVRFLSPHCFANYYFKQLRNSKGTTINDVTQRGEGFFFFDQVNNEKVLDTRVDGGLKKPILPLEHLTKFELSLK